MSFIGKAVGSIVGGITGASDQADAAKQAAATQAAAAQQGIAAQQQALQQYQQMISPFVNAGASALGAQQNLLGLNGNDAQQSAISTLQASPQFTALQKQGEDSILANASATGGLRGGNIQGTLAQFSPALLAQIINQQYGNLGGLANTGANAAAGMGSASLNTGSNIAGLLQQQGAATAGGQIAAGNVTANGFNSLLGLGGTVAGLGGFSGLGNLFGGSGYDASAARAAASATQSGSLLSDFTPSTSLPNVSLPMLTKF